MNIRSVRLGGVALVDALATIAAALLWWRWKSPKVTWYGSIIAFFTLGVVLHYLFGISTALNRFLGLA